MYTVEEVEVPEGYNVRVTGDRRSGFTVTNTHAPEVIGINVQKKWVGEVALRPSVVFTLMGSIPNQVLVLTADKGWKGAFEDRSTRATEIAYTIVEDHISRYTSRVDKDRAAGFRRDDTRTPRAGSPRPVPMQWASVRRPLLANGAGGGWPGSGRAQEGLRIADPHGR